MEGRWMEMEKCQEVYLPSDVRTRLTNRCAHSLHWVKYRFIWLPNVLLVSKWIYLFYQLLALPCTHCLREAIEAADNWAQITVLRILLLSHQALFAFVPLMTFQAAQKIADAGPRTSNYHWDLNPTQPSLNPIHLCSSEFLNRIRTSRHSFPWRYSGHHF